MDVLIIGSGPAAAGAALALCDAPGVTVRILDVGGRLEATNEAARQRMSASAPDGWSADDRGTISKVAAPTSTHKLPEKRVFGSSFPFDDFGQLDGVSAQANENTHVISGAYGGFSNTWGAQTMPYSAASFDAWPIAREELSSDYRAVLGALPFSGEPDDLEEYFPLYADADPLPALSENSSRILDSYRRHRLQVRRQGVIMGKARLALRGSACVSCGLCMTGCPYSYVYSASQTFDDLIANDRVEYIDGQLALSLGEDDEGPFVTARKVNDGTVSTFRADKVLVACGSIGTTRLVASSLGQWSRPIHLQESVQFLMPLAALRGNKRLSQDGSFTLNQFNMVMPFDEAGRDLVQIHGYPYNEAMNDAVPGILRTPMLRVLRDMLLKRLTVGLGYLPSWWSAGFDVTVEKPDEADQPARVVLSHSSTAHDQSKKRLRAINARLLRAAPYLGVFPVIPMVTMSAPGKSYHFGGSFPHSNEPVPGHESDLLGRVHPWRNVHLVDASVFPTVSATTFTLTIMANAHRIARLVAQGKDV